MESSSVKPNEPSRQPYVQVSQVDVESGPSINGKDAESNPEARGDSKETSELSNTKGNPVVLGTTARLWTSWVHLLPLTLSAFLIAINIRRWYWFDEEGNRDLRLWGITTDTIMNLLQFVAKVHELLVIASLGALILKLFKRRLVDSEVPLGLLTGAYRVGDIPYIFSSPFLRAAWGSSWLLALVLFANTMLATLVGPSSAILLVPNLDWYSLPGAFSKIQPGVYYDLYANGTWPRVASTALLNQNNQLETCDGFGGWYAFWCPAAAYSDLWSWLRERASAELDNDLIVQDPTGSVRRRLSAKETINRDAVAMTTVSLPPLLTISRLLSFIKSGDIGTIGDTQKFKLNTTSESTIFQPLVQTSCAVFDRADLSSTSLPYYATGRLNCLGDSDCENMLKVLWFVDESIWNVSHSRPMFGLLASNASYNHPLLASAAIPHRNGTRVETWIFGCSIIAHWMPAALSISPADSNFVESNVTDAISNFYLDASTISVGTAINIKSDWLHYLLPEMNITLPNGTIQRTSQLDSIFEPLFNPFRSGNETVLVFDPARDQDGDISERRTNIERTQSFVQKVFGAIVTEGLARVASNSKSYVVRSSNDTAVVVANIGEEGDISDTVYDWSNGTGVRKDAFGVEKIDESIKTPQQFLNHMALLTRLDFEAERYGYGSGKVGPTMDFALAVMYAYFVVVGTYFLHVMVVPRLWRKQDAPTIVAWGDVVDLILLAWNSKPSPNPKLSQSSVNVENSNPWKIDVGIRAEATGRTQLATNGEGVEKLRRNVPYY